jgi:hypothetical protein
MFVDVGGDEDGGECGGGVDGGFEPFCTFGTETQGFSGGDDVWAGQADAGSRCCGGDVAEEGRRPHCPWRLNAVVCTIYNGDGEGQLAFDSKCEGKSWDHQKVIFIASANNPHALLLRKRRWQTQRERMQRNTHVLYWSYSVDTPILVGYQEHPLWRKSRNTSQPAKTSTQPCENSMKCYRTSGHGHRLTQRKYKFMEVNRIKNLQRLRVSIPDLQKTFDTVKFLDSKKVLEVRCTGWLMIG